MSGEPLPAELQAAAELARKAGAACAKGRYCSFVERSARALEEARPHCAPDTSLILAQLLLRTHCALEQSTRARSEREGLIFRGVGHLEEAVAILARRHAAGTLVPSLPLEQRFYEHSVELPSEISVSIAGVAAFSGYLQYVNACTCLITRLFLSGIGLLDDASGCLVPRWPELQLPRALKAAYAQFMLAGLDMMHDMHDDGRVHRGWPSTVYLCEEVELLMGLHKVTCSIGLDHVIPGTWVDEVLRQFQRLFVTERAMWLSDSNVWHELTTGTSLAEAATRAADVAKHGLQRCGLASCGAMEAHPRHFKRCAKCNHGSAAYCCKEHQAEHWHAGHRQACKALRPQAAPAER